MSQPRRTGLPDLGRLSLGCNSFGTRLDRKDSDRVVRAALDLGVLHFDTAAMYGDGESERLLGLALAADRDGVRIATKLGGADRTGQRVGAPASAANVRRSCEDSLGRLGTDHVDLLYLHVPDLETPVEETSAALAELVTDGLALGLAASNHSSEQLQQLAAALQVHGVDLLVDQLEWNLLRREAEQELVPTCRSFGIGIVPYFPLASGVLTGKYRRDEPHPAGTRLAEWPRFAAGVDAAVFDRVDRLAAVAAAAGRTLLELAIQWLLHQDGVVTVLAGATTPEQVRANTAAAERDLEPEVIRAVDVALGT